MSLEDIAEGKPPALAGEQLSTEGRHKGRVVGIHRDDVFVELGQRQQGVLSLQSLPEPPEVGAEIEVRINRFNAEEGLYHLSLPGAAIEAGDWSELNEGSVVMATITGQNKGGLECQVGKIRGFIPASQVSLYHVEDLSQFVEQKLPCVITEAKPEKRNLVLSHRAVLEREREQAKEQLLQELESGQVREGVVSRILDFGAFVDLGGVDGLLHVSRLSWTRVNHPSDVLKEGDRVKVKVEKIDPKTHKIALSMRDFVENPWDKASQNYAPKTRVTGKVVKIMDFGAFIELEPGVEGLVHISELDHKRVFRVSDVVKEGEEVEAEVLSVEADKQRIKLSIKALRAAPARPGKKAEEVEDPADTPRLKVKHKGPLKGGVGKPTGGDQFGLKW